MAALNFAPSKPWFSREATSGDWIPYNEVDAEILERCWLSRGTHCKISMDRIVHFDHRCRSRPMWQVKTRAHDNHLDVLRVVWYWLADKVWQPYPPEEAIRLEHASVNRQGRCDLNKTYEAVLQDEQVRLVVQRHLSDRSRERHITRIWCWAENEDGNWALYAPAESAKLEFDDIARKRVCAILNRQYEVRLSSKPMLQVHTKDYNRQREVMRPRVGYDRCSNNPKSEQQEHVEPRAKRQKKEIARGEPQNFLAVAAVAESVARAAEAKAVQEQLKLVQATAEFKRENVKAQAELAQAKASQEKARAKQEEAKAEQAQARAEEAEASKRVEWAKAQQEEAETQRAQSQAEQARQTTLAAAATAEKAQHDAAAARKLAQTDDLFLCPVCFEQYTTPHILPRILSCGHTFCQPCLSMMLAPLPTDNGAKVCSADACLRLYRA
jgi:hypothetical protein